MKKIPLVSICCITFNHAAYIKKCLDGFVMQQTKFPFEVIIHDDASIDGTQEIIKDYINRFPDLFVPILQKENQYSKGVKRILATFCYPISKGKYIALCEGDDYWTDPLKLQKQVDFMEAHPNSTLCYTDVSFRIEKENRIIPSVFESYYLARHHGFSELLVNKAYLAPCSWLVKKEYFIIPSELSDAIDGTFAMALYNFAEGQVYYINQTTCTYRVLENSASHLTDKFKMYIRAKGLYFIQKYYINKYLDKLPDSEIRQIKNNEFKGLLLHAWYYKDEPMKNEIKSYSRLSLKYRILINLLDYEWMRKCIPLYHRLKNKLHSISHEP